MTSSAAADLMTSSPPDLIDTFALTAIAQLINAYGPDDLAYEKGKIESWCEIIARTSYYMAATMMDCRTAMHEIATEIAANEEDDNT